MEQVKFSQFSNGNIKLQTQVTVIMRFRYGILPKFLVLECRDSADILDFHLQYPGIPTLVSSQLSLFSSLSFASGVASWQKEGSQIAKSNHLIYPTWQMMAIDGLEFPFGKTDATYMKYSEQVNPKRQKADFTCCLSLVLDCRNWTEGEIGNDGLMSFFSG